MRPTMHAPHPFDPDSASRRAFLRRGGALSLAASAAPWALTLSAISDAAAQSAPDYKALVCVFLQGGNDHWNTLVPYDSTHHALYQGLRSNIAYSRDALASSVLQPTAAATDGRQFALAPTLAAVSAGAVFMGANTYIGNAPNLMVKAIAEDRGVKMPSFFGYMAWSGAVLIPLFIAMTFIWFR